MRVNEELRSLAKKEQRRKKNFVILLLYPRYPSQEKKRILDLQEKLKSEKKWPNTYLMEEFKAHLNHDDKFRLLASDEGLEPDLIAAIFTEEGSREGESWELGFLWSKAVENYLSTGQKESYERFLRQTVTFIEKGVHEKELCTGLLTMGTFKKIVVHSFKDDDELLNLIDSTAKRLLDYKFGLLEGK